KLIFAANFPGIGNEIGVSDGTAAGTKPLVDINSGPSSSFPHNFTRLGNMLLFAAEIPGIPFLTYHLFVTDGTAEGTKDITPSQMASINWAPITVLGNSAYFGAFDNEHGSELWSTDGSAAGTKLVKDIYPGAMGSGPGNLTVLAGQVFFVASDG